MRILTEEAAAMVNDIQERLLSQIDEGSVIVSNCLTPEIAEVIRMAGNATFKNISGIVK